MSHGKNCNCPICGLGKKMGMIKTDDKPTKHPSDDHSQHSHGHEHGDGHKCEHC